MQASWDDPPDAKSRKQLGAALNLVEYDQSAQWREGEFRIAEASEVGSLLEIKKVNAALLIQSQTACERRLADLSCADNRCDGIGGQQAFELAKVR